MCVCLCVNMPSEYYELKTRKSTQNNVDKKLQTLRNPENPTEH